MRIRMAFDVPALPHRVKTRTAIEVESAYFDSLLFVCRESVMSGTGGNQSTEPVVFDDELADEFVQAALKNSVHAAVLQARADAACLPLRRPLPIVGARDRIEVSHDRLV